MPESLTTEYKKSFGKEVIISLVAFANAEGGAVVIGVDDNGHPCGVDVGPETVQRYINEIKVATYPQLIPEMFEKKHSRTRKPISRGVAEGRHESTAYVLNQQLKDLWFLSSRVTSTALRETV